MSVVGGPTGGAGGGAVVDCRSLEIWLQSGIPEDGDLVFNVHIRNLATEEWEVRELQYFSLFLHVILLIYLVPFASTTPP